MTIARAVLWMFVVTVPLDVWPVPGIGSISVAAGIPLVIAALLTISRKGTIRRATRSHVMMASFVFWSALSFFWTADPDATEQRIFTNLALLAFAWIYWQLHDRERDPDDIMFAFVIGCWIACAATIANLIRGETTFVFETRYAASGFDPNDLGVTLAIGIPFAWTCFWRRRGWTRLVCLAYLPASAVAISLTASRGAAATAIVGLLIVPLGEGSMNIHKRVLVTVAAIGTAAVAALTLVPAGAWERILTFGQQVQGGSLNGRSEFWRAGLQALSAHWLTGVGAGAYGAAMEMLLHEWVPAHNAFVSVLVELGPIGLLLFLGILGSAIPRAFRARPSLTAFVCVTWMVGVSSLTWEYRKTTWFVFIIVAHVAAKYATVTGTKSQVVFRRPRPETVADAASRS